MTTTRFSALTDFATATALADADAAVGASVVLDEPARARERDGRSARTVPARRGEGDRRGSGGAAAGRVARHALGSLATSLGATLREPLTLDGACLLDAGPAADPHSLARLAESLGEVRAALMERLADDDFQSRLVALTAALAARHFPGERSLFQRRPSLRLHLPDALGTSWHTDNWYGHPGSSMTFWLPLGEVPRGAGVRFASDPGLLASIESRLGEDLALDEVNALCGAASEEVRCAPGEYLAFGARALHGSVANTSGRFRCSLDFRGMPAAGGVGNKSRAQYRAIGADGRPETDEAADAFAGGRAVKYINGATGASTKYQHVLLEAYARENALAVVRNEAEIEAVPSRPVLAAYARRDAPDPRGYDHLLLGSIDQLPHERAASRRLLERSAAAGVALHFVAEDRVFPATIGLDECLARRGSRGRDRSTPHR